MDPQNESNQWGDAPPPQMPPPGGAPQAGQPTPGPSPAWGPPPGAAAPNPAGVPPTGGQGPADWAEPGAAVATKKKPRLLSRVAVVGAAVVVVGAGGYAARAALMDPAGPSSPEDALTAFMESFADEDLAGMAEVIDPYERDSIIEPMLRVSGELDRLGFLNTEDGRYPSLSFVEVDLEDFTVETEEITPGLVEVRSTGGSLTVTSVPDEFPDWIRDLDDAAAGTGPLSQPETNTIDLQAQSMRVMTVERDGSWYVTGYYSMAEEIRRDMNGPLPRLGEGPEPVGSESAEDVIGDFLQEATEFDLTGMLTMLDPHEAAVLYDYSPMYLNDGQQLLNSLRDEVNADISVVVSDANATNSGGRTFVTVGGVALTIAVDGDTVVYEYRDGCITFTLDGAEQERACRDELPFDPNEIWQALEEELGLTPAEVDALRSLSDRVIAVETGLTVVERDGRWYISLVPSLMHFGADYLEVIERSDVDTIKSAMAKAVANGPEGISEGIMELVPSEIPSDPVSDPWPPEGESDDPGASSITEEPEEDPWPSAGSHGVLDAELFLPGSDLTEVPLAAPWTIGSVEPDVLVWAWTQGSRDGMSLDMAELMSTEDAVMVVESLPGATPYEGTVPEGAIVVHHEGLVVAQYDWYVLFAEEASAGYLLDTVELLSTLF